MLSVRKEERKGRDIYRVYSGSERTTKWFYRRARAVRWVAQQARRAVPNPLQSTGSDTYRAMETPECGPDQYNGHRLWFKELGVGKQNHAVAAKHWVRWLDTRLRARGLQTREFLGSGAWGVVYSLEKTDGSPTNIVAKITQDPSEAAAVARLGKNHPLAFPVALGAWRISGEPMWVILREGLRPLTTLSKSARDFLRTNEDAISYAEGHGDNCALVTQRTLERFDEGLEQLSAADRAMVARYFDGIAQAQEELGVQVLDVNLDNLRVRQRASGVQDLVVSDLGLSVGPQTEIPVAANPRLRFSRRGS